jgi:hypothetical protein
MPGFPEKFPRGCRSLTDFREKNPLTYPRTKTIIVGC